MTVADYLVLKGVLIIFQKLAGQPIHRAFINVGTRWRDHPIPHVEVVIGGLEQPVLPLINVCLARHRATRDRPQTCLIISVFLIGGRADPLINGVDARFIQHPLWPSYGVNTNTELPGEGCKVPCQVQGDTLHLSAPEYHGRGHHEEAVVP